MALTAGILHFGVLLRSQSCCQSTRLRTKGLCGFHTSQWHRGRRKMPRNLTYFAQELADNEKQQCDTVTNVHLNPALHWTAMHSQDQDVRPVGSSLKALRVCVLGVPNSGKSTLVNTLCGFTACPYSSKVHTTRRTSKAILSEGDTQLVFSDTPGVISRQEADSFKVEETLLTHPEGGCQEADLLLIVQDVSNRYVREAIDKKVLRLLCLFNHVPAVLVLNKMDTIPESRRVYDLIRKLTCNHLENKELMVHKKNQTHLHPKHTVSSYFRAKVRKSEANADEAVSSLRKAQLTNQEFMQVLRERKTNISREELKDLLNGVVGWPGFSEVFSVSSLDGRGIDELKYFLLSRARTVKQWDFSPRLQTSDDPRDLVTRMMKAKLLDHLPNDLPYKLNPKIETWRVDSGVLRVGIILESPTPRHTRYLLRGKPAGVRQIAQLTEKDLQNFFQSEVFVTVNVECKHKSKYERQELGESPTLDMFL